MRAGILSVRVLVRKEKFLCRQRQTMFLERSSPEHESKVEVRTVKDKATLDTAALLISEYSWGRNYPVKPLDEILEAEYCAGAYAADSLVGFAGVSRHASPDGEGDGELWLGYAVVAPEFRQQGIYEALYDACMTYMKSAAGRLLSCTDNPVIEKFLLANDWHFIRETRDESGAACFVFEYDRNTTRHHFR